MRGAKHFAFFFFVETLFLLAYVYFESGNILTIISEPFFWLIPFAFTSIGYIVGIFIYKLELNQVTKKRKIFRNSYIFSFICLILFILSTRSDHNDERSITKSELLNHALKSIKDETKGSFLIALKELNSNLNSPIDNDIQRFIVVNKDTIVNEENEKLVKIYFFYTTNIKKRDTLFSRISIYREKPTLELFNVKSTGNSEYQNFDTKDIELEYSAF